MWACTFVTYIQCMTRINIGIPPETLTKKHLIAEHHEIVRLPGYLRMYGETKALRLAPKSFVLGRGHVLFCVAHGKHTLDRYKRIRKDCLRRNIACEDFSHLWDVYKDYETYFADYIPSRADVQLITQRLIERDHAYKNVFNGSIPAFYYSLL